MFQKMIAFALRRPRLIFAAIGVVTVAAAAQFFNVKVDTDPENMLPEKEFVRVFDHQVKKDFALYDYVVLGIVNEQDPNGIFNPDTLEKVYRISTYAKSVKGVIAYELMSLANKDDITQAGPGALSFQWLMQEPPYTQEEALRIKERAFANPMFFDTLASRDGKAVCIYIPIEKKTVSYRVAEEMRKFVARYSGADMFYLTGLPLAEDAFGTEMFTQMAISAPLAMVVIFLLMLFFFKNWRLVVMPLVMGVVVVIVTMGLMVGLGFPIHIMSSMIPIFLLPIAVLDSIHILNDFFEKYKNHGGKKEVITAVLTDLFKPNLFTTLTTMAGFVSLSFTPIPPVQVFGIFVALGVALAWLATVLLVPAYIALIPDAALEGFGATHEELQKGWGSKALAWFGAFIVRKWKAVLVCSCIVVGVSLYGIARIQVNDNPVKWFNKKHPIRIADKVLNAHFGGTYSAYLVLTAADMQAGVFQEPAALAYIERLQQHLEKGGKVGKSTSLADVTKKVYYELLGGDPANNVIPRTRQAVAQCLISYENSHKPDDLYHFVTPDFGRTNVWLQLKSGDNKDMEAVVADVRAYVKNNPPPFAIHYQWAGLTYINMVWQDKMVVGMFVNFLGSFIIVLCMMIWLLRSPVAGLISMIPLTITILFIYAALGFTGKEYDMPVAVLSALTLGLAIDYAIHFIQRSRELWAKNPDWQYVSKEMFATPARALVKNALVVSIGFLPLFASPLVPYNTVGFFMFMIMLVSSIGTLIILPAVITGFPQAVFGENKKGITCACGSCMLMALIIACAVVYVLLGYEFMKWKAALLMGVLTVAVCAGACRLLVRRTQCRP